MAFWLRKLKPVTGKKKNITSLSCTIEPVVQSCDTGQWIPFWQLSIEHNMDVHKISTIKLNTECICLGHLADAGSLKENLARLAAI